MAFSTTTLLLVAGGYLALLFIIAFACDRGWLSARLTQHPLTYVLSLGVYTSAWTVYASIGYAARQGFNFLAFFLGVSGIFLLAPWLLMPLLRLTRDHQLASLADLFAFRYRSGMAGTVTSLLLLVGMLPLLTLQIQAVDTSIAILSNDAFSHSGALWFCLLVLLFTVLFGTRHLSQRHQHEGLVTAIAFESLLKLLAFAGVTCAGIFGVFHGVDGLSSWLAAHPEAIERMYAPLGNGTWHSLIVAFFIGAIAMPHLFHMTFTENTDSRALVIASWGLPLLMLLTALCIPLILWAGTAGQVPTSADYQVLGIGLITHPAVAMLGYLAGLASASGMLIVMTLALSSMCLNHVYLPLARARTLDNLYAPLLWTRRLLIAAIIFLAYAFYRLAPANNLTELGSLSFVAALQFAPGLVGLLLWPGANRTGFHAGLAFGFAIWAVSLLQTSLDIAIFPDLLATLFPDNGDPLQQSYNVATVSLVVNALVMIVVSLVTRTRPEEQDAAETCALDSTRRSHRWALHAVSVQDFEQALLDSLGPQSARRELNLALRDLGLDANETRPYALRRLRDRIESNLTGLVGPAIAHEVVNKRLPYRQNQLEKPEDTQLIESRIEMYRDRLSGLAAELDSLRRFHRQTLLELPMGVISLSDDDEIIGWNHAMKSLTGIDAADVVGARIDKLPSPWAKPLSEFLAGSADHDSRRAVEDAQQRRWLNLHKSHVRGTSANEPGNGLVIVVEDITERRLLESRLAHNERLASIGRLAAGVAHEIGNPVTAIACVAQNLEHDLSEADVDEVSRNLRLIMEQTHRISRIVESLVSFSHSGLPQAAPERLPVTLCDTVNEAIKLLTLDPDYHDQCFANQLPADLAAAGDTQRLLQVFINLLGNACDACNRTDPIVIDGHPDGCWIVVTVTDSGSGIAPDLRDKLFEPFVTSKAPGHGTGLGLSLVYSIMEEHGGSISIDSPIKEDHGTRIILTLPRFSSEESPTP